MRFSLKGGRSHKPSRINLFPEGAQHPDLPLSPNPQSQSQSSSPRPDDSSVTRRAPTSERFTSGYAGDRRSIAVEPGYDPSLPYSPDDISSPNSPHVSGGLTRAQTVLRREGARRGDRSEPPPSWAPDPARLPTPTEQPGAEQRELNIESGAHMNHYPPTTPRKTSTDSGLSAGGTDRWLARRLQRQNTEQGYRDQRQGAHSIYTSPTLVSEQSAYHPAVSPTYPVHEQQLSSPPQQPAYHVERSVIPTSANAASGTQAHQPVSSLPRSNTYTRHDSSPQYILSSQPYSPSAEPTLPNVSAENIRPGLTTGRSYTQQQQHQQGGPEDNTSMSSSNNGSLPAPKASRSGGANRQSMHNGLSAREGTTNLGPGQQTGGQQQGGVPAFNASVVPPANQSQGYQGNNQPQQTMDVGRTKTPQPVQTSEDMTDEEINQLIKDHKELREKYTKVKKYYFEKEDQVKQLQNSLAHQRLSQSRTSLDDSEYTTRFNRLDGLIAQLAFAIRKSWRSIPPLLVGSVNRDAVSVGKQEMTAAGRAFISYWLVEEVFEKFFHPDLDPLLSSHLKSIQRNIRHFAPFAQTAEEEEYLTSKVVNWRLSTLEGLQEELRSPQCAANRASLTDNLKRDLVSAIAGHLQDPPPSDLEGGVHMIIELVVSIASHLPLESRDVVIEYFNPGYSILHDQMKLEQGIPPLTVSVADEAAEHGSVDDGDSVDSDILADSADGSTSVMKKAGGMLSALAPGKPKGGAGAGGNDQPRKNAGAGMSSGSLSRPESASGVRGDPVPRVRMAAGIGVQIRGRSVLVKAPVFATS